jgi:hypothetical protein
MPELSTIYDYMRAHSSLLGERILQEYPALHQFDDPVSPWIADLLRRPFPAQTIAIMGVAKRWQRARTGMVVAECGTGKTLISLGAIRVHSEHFTPSLEFAFSCSTTCGTAATRTRRTVSTRCG